MSFTSICNEIFRWDILFPWRLSCLYFSYIYDLLLKFHISTPINLFVLLWFLVLLSLLWMVSYYQIVVCIEAWLVLFNTRLWHVQILLTCILVVKRIFRYLQGNFTYGIPHLLLWWFLILMLIELGLLIVNALLLDLLSFWVQILCLSAQRSNRQFLNPL